VIKDIATRYRHSFTLTDKTATQMAREIRKIYNDPNCPLSWPKVLIVDKGTEYMGECRDLFLRHGMRIQYAKSKRSMAIAEQDHQEFEKHVFFRQDAMDLYLPLTDRSREWVVSLHINDDKYNDSLTKLIHISSNEAVKKSLEGKKIFADPTVKHKRPIGYDEPLLLSDVKVRHLLEPGELEGWRKRATDCNWSPEIFLIESFSRKNNQPVLYKLHNSQPPYTMYSGNLLILDTLIPNHIEIYIIPEL
ncbi:19375_t:CDS:2, partial [Cetraspora pellucida]